MKNRRGAILLLVLFTSTSLLMVALYLVQLQAGRNNAVRRLVHTMEAEAAARAGLARSLAELSADTGWTGDLQGVLEHSGARYELTFGKAAGPYSLNNTRGAVQAQGYAGRLVPPGMVHLVSVGRFSNEGWMEEGHHLQTWNQSAGKYATPLIRYSILPSQHEGGVSP